MNSPTPYDLSLLESARLGNPEAIDTLLAVAQPDIRRYARMSCHAADAEDAVQETLWLLYRKVGTLRTLQSFAGWLFTVTRRECLRLARAFIGQGISFESVDVEHLYANRPPEDLRIDLARAIQSLPEHYRAIILLRDFEEQTIDEIATSLGLSREAVKARLHRARRLIREYLQP